MHRPYRTFYLSRLRGIAHQNWDSRYTLEKIATELTVRAPRDYDRQAAVLMFQCEIMERAEELKKKERQEVVDWEEANRKQKEIKIEIDRKTFFKKHGYFKWPTTTAPMGEGGMTAFWYEYGLFSYVGYHVGNTNGKPDDVRQELLDCIFHNDLPKVQSEEYMQGFGTPKTPRRLNKMADFLSAEARNFKRISSGDYSKAIADYEQDLVYLYNEYYVGVFGFDWPTV